LALKIGVAILRPAAARTSPATTTTVSTAARTASRRGQSARRRGVITVLVCEKAQFLAVARSHA